MSSKTDLRKGRGLNFHPQAIAAVVRIDKRPLGRVAFLGDKVVVKSDAKSALVLAKPPLTLNVK